MAYFSPERTFSQRWDYVQSGVNQIKLFIMMGLFNMTEINQYTEKLFDDIKHFNEEGFEFLYAKQLA